ncbi:cell division control protein 2 homolog 1-like [Lotus japonicus]|uniref:cell division control protein 2 homolog 1-like n=1 Tax=Lotus japonicus TaxID=34305 RepID=UPI00258B8DCB|nr:cell division control protein 2 homolog 1-like [Lotus japonicus]
MAREERGSSSSDSWIVRMFQCRIFSCFTPPQQRLEGFNDMEILDEIAEGGFGRVFRCRDRSTGDIVAVKQIELPADITNRASIKINREIELLQQVNHDNIVRLLRHVQTEDRRYVYLVFELLDCDLFQYIRRSRRLFVEPWLRKRFLHQILTAVAYCHANQILHRDLKPKNLLIDESRDIIKLADFGLARPFGDPTGQYTDKKRE